MRIFRKIIHFLFLLICCGGIAFAKRGAPKPVAPVSVGELEYRACYDVDHLGSVEVWDLKTHSQIGSILVYKTKYLSRMERDVQWVFITKLEVHGNDMLVVNERGDSYRVDLRTKRVTRVNSE